MIWTWLGGNLLAGVLVVIYANYLRSTLACRDPKESVICGFEVIIFETVIVLGALILVALNILVWVFVLIWKSQAGRSTR